MDTNGTILMLPPLPGTDTPHPGFEIDSIGHAECCWKREHVRTEIAMRIRMGYEDGKEFNPIAAAAIAFNWIAAYQAQVVKKHGLYWKNVRSPEDDNFICDQIDAWAEIATGSRDYDNCKIVAYEPRKG